MKTISFIPFYVIIGLNIVCAQVPSNSLFIIVNKKSDSIDFKQTKGSDQFTLSFVGGEKQTKWTVVMHHHNSENIPQSLFQYLLPKTMVENFKRKGNAIPLKKFIQQTRFLDIAGIHQQIRLRSYYYEYIEGSRYKTDLRQNIFLIFESELHNKRIKCYELDVLSYSNDPIE